MPGDQGYIIEFHRIGNSVKVTAMDPDSLTEVTIIGPPNIGETELKRQVVRKLEYMLAKRGTNPANR
jgi:stage III sporulation protein SpoIIIAA